MEMVTTPTAAPDADTTFTERRLHGWSFYSVLLALGLTMLLSALDQTIVDTAIPKILGDLHGLDRYSWLVTIYLLTSTTMIPIVGKLSDLFGRKWFMVGGVAIFLVGSALCGTAQTMNQLIIFRGLQGLGSGTLQALIFTLIADIFPPKERARYTGLFAGVFALASVIGPTAGGWITDHASWRWVFYINLPLGILAFVALLIWLPVTISTPTNHERGSAALRHIDFIGAATAASGTVCLLLGLTWGGQTYPWGSPQVIGVLLAAAILFTSFIVVELRAREPIIPLDLFRNRAYASSALLSLALGAALFAVVVYLPLFIQNVLGQSATSSGVVITPVTISLAIFASISGVVIARIGRYQVVAIIGALVLTGGVALVTTMTTATQLGTVTRDMIVVGIGMGIIQPVITVAAQNAVPQQRLGVGTAAINYLRSMGSTLATAVLATVVNTTFTNQVTKRLPAAAHQLPAQAVKAVTDQSFLTNAQYRHQVTQRVVDAATAAVPAGPNHDAATTQVTEQITTLLHQVLDASRQALFTGIHNAFIVALCICAAAVVITLFMRDGALVAATSKAPAAPSTSPGATIATGTTASH